MLRQSLLEPRKSRGGQLFLYNFAHVGVYLAGTGKSMACAQVNTGWCESLYRRKAAGLILYGRALGLSHGEAEDVLQETFLALIQMEQPPAQPENYCLRSYRNRGLNYRRTLWRRLTRELESRRWFDRPAQAGDVEEQAMRKLADLPAEQREVIVLKIWNELTFEEIGELLGLSPHTVAGRYRYGLGKLKLSLKGKQYEPERALGDAVAVMDSAPPLG